MASKPFFQSKRPAKLLALITTYSFLSTISGLGQKLSLVRLDDNNLHASLFADQNQPALVAHRLKQRGSIRAVKDQVPVILSGQVAFIDNRRLKQIFKAKDQGFDVRALADQNVVCRTDMNSLRRAGLKASC